MEYSCPNCSNEKLIESDADLDKEGSIVNGKYKCTSCGAKYPEYCGVPYLGEFYEEDLFSVMEITSFLHDVNIGEDGKPRRGGSQTTQSNKSDAWRNLRNLLDAICEEGEDDFNFSSYGYAKRPRWLTARLNGHRQFKQSIHGLDFNNKTLLDVGAGTGFDACWLSDFGAKLVCLEYNPLQAAVGKEEFPEFQWLGATVEKIPFADESFDYVVANHALHHMVHLEAGLQEMLRVLKVGGYLLTIADSYSPNTFTENDEVSVFNNHAAVLRGVNEQLPQLERFISPLKEQKDNLSVTIMTPVVHGLHVRSDEMRSWTLEEASELLSKHRGGICMRVQKLDKHKNLINTESRKNPIINFNDYLTSLVTRTSALTKLVEFVPDWTLDQPITGTEHPKFRLLLGWQKQEKQEKFRRAKSEAHMFVTKNHLEVLLSKLVVKVPRADQADEISLEFKVNGSTIFEESCEAGGSVKLNINNLDFNKIIKERNLFSISASAKSSAESYDGLIYVYEDNINSKFGRVKRIIDQYLPNF